MGVYSRAFQTLNERKWQKVQSSPIIRRVDAKRGKLACRIERNKGSKSMLAAKHPKGMPHIPLYLDSRTKEMMESYRRRLVNRGKVSFGR